MSILTCKELPLVRNSSAVGTEGTCQREWLIHTDDKYNSGTKVLIDALAGGHLPNYLAPHPDNIFFTLRKLAAKEHEGPTWWVASGEYSTAPLTNAEREKTEPNPLLRKATVGPWETQQFTEAIHRDINGHAIVNSAGDYYDPPAEREASYWTVQVEKNVAAVPQWFLEYENSTNEAEVVIKGLTVLKGCARLYRMRISEELEENGVRFYRLSFTLVFRKPPPPHNVKDPANAEDPLEPDGHMLVLLDQGLRTKRIEITTGDTIIENMTDSNGEFLTSPAALNGFGLQLSDSTALKPDDMIYFAYEVYEPKDYAIIVALMS